MKEDISGPYGSFRVRASERGIAMVHELSNDEPARCICVVASATAAIRFAERMSRTGSERIAWIAAGY